MTRVEYHIIRASGEVSSSFCELPDDAREAWRMVRDIVLDEIGRDNKLEHVLVYWDGKYLDMFVDENGLAQGLPRNEFATRIYRNNIMTHEPGVTAEELPFIVGDAVLLSERLWK
jgi:hypothetical protein